MSKMDVKVFSSISAATCDVSVKNNIRARQAKNVRLHHIAKTQKNEKKNAKTRESYGYQSLMKILATSGPKIFTKCLQCDCKVPW